MSVLLLQYPPCSTCRNARKWLEDRGVVFEDRNIKEHNPTEAELTEWVKRSGKSVKSFFNTSGLVYKENELKDKLPHLSDISKIKLLSENGMLVKRPLVIADNFVLVGFREAEWVSAFSDKAFPASS